MQVSRYISILRGRVARWQRDIRGTAAAEFTLVFPILMILLFGVYEIGTALTVNQKAITSSQIMADLLSRNNSVDNAMVDDIVRAGELAMAPYDLVDFGVDIVSLRYDQNDNPQIVWRETRNMDPDPAVLTNAQNLGVEGDGALAVVVKYMYRPTFAGSVVGDIPMREVTYARGRRVAVVTLN